MISAEKYGVMYMKEQLLTKMLELEILESEALKNESIDVAQDLIKQKQVCIDQINALIGDCPWQPNEKERELLLQIQKIDEQNKQILSKQFEDAKQALRKLRELKKRNTIYSNPYDTYFEEGIFIDKK